MFSDIVTVVPMLPHDNEYAFPIYTVRGVIERKGAGYTVWNAEYKNNLLPNN